MKSTTPPTTLREFLEFFSAIPEDQWTTGQFVRRDASDGITRRCASGHLQNVSPDLWGWRASLLRESLYIDKSCPISDINDGLHPGYPRGRYPTPKQRICAAIIDSIYLSQKQAI